MAGLNKVQLIGHLGADPEARSLNNGGEVVNLRIATSETSSLVHLFHSGFSASLPAFTRLRKLACDSIAPLGLPVVPDV